MPRRASVVHRENVSNAAEQRRKWEEGQRMQYIGNFVEEHPDLAQADARQTQLELQHDQIKWKILQDVVSQNQIFSDLNSNQKQAVCDAMVPFAAHAGQEIIKEGNVGDFFYVVFNGEYSAHKHGSSKPLKHYSKGKSFGELALLFSKPRQASVVCNKSGTLYAIDRKTFKRVVAQNSLKGKPPKSDKQKMLEAMTKNVNLHKLSRVQQGKVAELMQRQTVQAGDIVIQEGDIGDYFYAVEHGKFDVRKTGRPGVIMCYEPGECFGDMALIHHNSVRQATVKARTDGALYRLKRSDYRIATGLDIPTSVTAAKLAIKLQKLYRQWQANHPPGSSHNVDPRPAHERLFATTTANSRNNMRSNPPWLRQGQGQGRGSQSARAGDRGDLGDGWDYNTNTKSVSTRPRTSREQRWGPLAHENKSVRVRAETVVLRMTSAGTGTAGGCMVPAPPRRNANGSGRSIGSRGGGSRGARMRHGATICGHHEHVLATPDPNALRFYLTGQKAKRNAHLGQPTLRIVQHTPGAFGQNKQSHMHTEHGRIRNASGGFYSA